MTPTDPFYLGILILTGAFTGIISGLLVWEGALSCLLSTIQYWLLQETGLQPDLALRACLKIQPDLTIGIGLHI